MSRNATRNQKNALLRLARAQGLDTRQGRGDRVYQEKYRIGRNKMQDCEITIDRDIAAFWVTVAIILTTAKITFIPVISWWWIGWATSMPFLIAVGVIVLMAIDVGVWWAGRQTSARIQSQFRRWKSSRQHRHTDEDTSSR